MSTPMETDCDAAAAEMRPIDLSVRKRSVSPDERATTTEDGPPSPVEDGPSSPVEVQPVVAPRPSVVIMQQQSPAAVESSDARKPRAVVSPQMADVAPPRTPDDGHRSAADSSSHRLPPPQPAPLFFAADHDGPFGSAMAALQRQPSALFGTPRTSRLDRELQQQRLDLALQQRQLQLQQQQQQQLRFQQQLHQHQLQLASFGDDGVHGALHLDTIMLARQMAAGLCVPMPPSPASSTESNPFPFPGSFGCMHQTSVNGFGYNNNNNNNTRSYFNGLSGGGRGSDGQLSPESTTSDDPLLRHHHHHYHVRDHHRFGGIFEAAALIMGGGPDVNAEDVADIYRTAEFQAFRQRYIDSLGPPRNYEKMRRSVPAGKQPPAFDLTYAQKRMKNNEAAKRSRDAKRQKFIENQISVMYLTKKIREMNELKRRLLVSMT